MNFATLLTSAPLHLVVTGAFLVALSVFFILSFCRPAWREARRLTQVLRALESKDLRDARDPQLLDKAFPKDGELAHLWREYKKTLYATSIEGPDGIAEVRWTSTAPAGAIVKSGV
jgi:hypothetical protein